MPTNYIDQFYTIDPFSPPPAGTQLNVTKLTLTDQNDDGDLDRFDNDSIGGLDIESSWPGDRVRVDVGGGNFVTYTGTTFYLSDGSRVFTPTDGKVLLDGTLVAASGVTDQGPLDVGNLGPPCFAAGTMIETDRGPVPIERIEEGDLVRTLDHGLQPVRWHGARGTPALGKRAPVRFAPGAIGNTRELLVSPQHKILLTGWRAELFFGEDEVLVAAVHLVNGDMIHRALRRHLTYHHLMFDAHEILFAEGVAAESFYPGDYILRDELLRDEIDDLFPEMTDAVGVDWNFARPVMAGAEAKVLCGDRLHHA